jgi:hypothetical protein
MTQQNRRAWVWKCTWGCWLCVCASAVWVDALTKRPPTKRPVNILSQTKCPLNILPQVTFCPSDIWTFMGWIVRPLFTSFLP